MLNGSKCYIANANIGKLIFAFARTDPNAPVHDGTSIFAVQPGTPGLKVGKVFNKHGWRFYQNAELFFENVRVADSNRLGAINGAHKKHGGKNSKFGDMEYAANALGICEAAVEMATLHGRTHRQSGKRLNEHQLFQLKTVGNAHADRGPALVRDARRAESDFNGTSRASTMAC